MCEENPRLVRKRLRLGEILRRRHLLELLERRALLAVEVCGNFKDYAGMKIARRAAAQRRHSLAAQSEHLAVRRAGGEVELRSALGRRNVDRSAKSREDDQLTERISRACKLMGINMLDHVIVTDGDFYSYREQGKI